MYAKYSALEEIDSSTPMTFDCMKSHSSVLHMYIRTIRRSTTPCYCEHRKRRAFSKVPTRLPNCSNLFMLRLSKIRMVRRRVNRVSKYENRISNEMFPGLRRFTHFAKNSCAITSLPFFATLPPPVLPSPPSPTPLHSNSLPALPPSPPLLPPTPPPRRDALPLAPSCSTCPPPFHPPYFRSPPAPFTTRRPSPPPSSLPVPPFRHPPISLSKNTVKAKRGAEGPKHILWVRALDTPNNPKEIAATPEKVNQKRERWLQFHDQQTAGIPGLFPMYVGLKVRTTEKSPKEETSLSSSILHVQ